MDITKCMGEGCPNKETCYRFTAKPEPMYQTYFTELPGKWIDVPEQDIDKSGVWICEMFWSIESYSAVNNIFE